MGRATKTHFTGKVQNSITQFRGTVGRKAGETGKKLMLVFLSGPGIWAKPTQKIVPIRGYQPPSVLPCQTAGTYRISVVSEDTSKPRSEQRALSNVFQ